MRTHARARKHTDTNTQTQTQTQRHKHTRAHTHTRTHAHTQTNVPMYKHTNTQTHKHTNTQTRTKQTHTHTRTQTQTHTHKLPGGDSVPIYAINKVLCASAVFSQGQRRRRNSRHGFDRNCMGAYEECEGSRTFAQLEHVGRTLAARYGAQALVATHSASTNVTKTDGSSACVCLAIALQLLCSGSS